MASGVLTSHPHFQWKSGSGAHAKEVNCGVVGDAIFTDMLAAASS